LSTGWPALVTGSRSGADSQPDGGHLDRGPAEGSRSGYKFLRWSRDGMAFWAVSDLNAQELADFVRLWQAG